MSIINLSSSKSLFSVRKFTYYAPKGKFFPIFEEIDIIKSSFFEIEEDVPNMEDIKYLTEKRDLELERFIMDIKTDMSTDIIKQRFDVLMKLTKQVRLAEDALIVYVVTKKIEDYNKKYGV
jgi:hypothetical protein